MSNSGSGGRSAKRPNNGPRKHGKRNQPGLAPRRVAAQLFAEVIGNQKSLDVALENTKLSKFSELYPQDKALARAIVSTTLRHFGEIDCLVKSKLRPKAKPMSQYLRGVLYTAVAQMHFMDVADHATVSLAVDAAGADHKAQHFKPLVNGVLRNILRERDSFQHDPMLNVPDWLGARLLPQYGAEKTSKIIQAHMHQAPLDLTVRKDPEDWAARLDGQVVGHTSVRLFKPAKIFELEGFKTGDWWVQDAAAAVPAELLLTGLAKKGAVEDAHILDACAAPGGETAQFASAGATVTALDISEQRLKRLEENLVRLDLRAKSITADLLELDETAKFNGVLLDAPCSATGTIRRHPDVPWLKTERQIGELVILQRKMLAKASKLLKPGGTLLYCTCSLLAAEGEDHLDYIQSDLGLTIDPIAQNEVALSAPLTVANGVFRSTPDISGGMDGFFAVRLMRP
ncbi:MAG: transcription antitermination factor NusB [Hyphomicrobiales bacterium]